MKEEYFQLGIDAAENLSQTVYMDGDIAILDSINELPHDHNCMKVNVFIIMACLEGKMSICINSKGYTIHTNEFLLCMPNAVLNDCMMSPDFKGKIMCLSSRVVQETMRMDNVLWSKAFRIKENPIIHVDKEGVELFHAYNMVAALRIKAHQRSYRRETITLLVRTLIYEILSELSGYVNSPGGDMARQKDILFKRFLELLSSCEVKPRGLTWYADKLSVTPKYLSTVCKLVSGKTAFEWINEYVMTDIRHQLKYSDRSIKQVSDYLNFPNISFFGKFVKAHTGLNPTGYRKQLREREVV